MDLKKGLPIVLILTTALFFTVSTTNALVEPEPFDLMKPLFAIYEKLQALSDFNIVKTVLALAKIFINCLVNSRTLKTANFTLLQDKLESLFNSLPNNSSSAPLISTDGITEFCTSDEFEALYNETWRADGQLKDMVNFFSCFGLPNAGALIRTLHLAFGCKGDPNMIPVGPAKCHTDLREQKTSNSLHPRSAHEYSPMFMSIYAGECKWDEYWAETNIKELLEFFATYKQQSNTVPMNMLIGKIQEPSKGREVRKLRFEPAIQNLIKDLDRQMLKDPAWKALFQIVVDVSKINFFELSFMETLLNVFEFLLWGTVFPDV